uniref:Uncharacterized protein n=1 Tax=Panagrolaimus davidi TaxID=227884 RepID=A0A914P6G6_9BILA
MTVKTDLNQSELPQKNIDKTQKKTTATTAKFLTGIVEERNNNNDGASKTIYNFAVNGAPENEINHQLKEVTAKEENGQSKLSETPQAIILQLNGNQNGASKTIYNPTVNGGSAAPVGQMKLPLLTKKLTAKSVWNSLPANIPNEEGQQQQQQKLEIASKTIYNPATNGGSLAPASKMKLPILTKESAAKSDWSTVLAASSIISANNEQQAAAADGKENGKKMS